MFPIQPLALFYQQGIYNLYNSVSKQAFPFPTACPQRELWLGPVLSHPVYQSRSDGLIALCHLPVYCVILLNTNTYTDVV
jgi:hypothetical protein